MNILRDSILYRGISSIGLNLMRAYRYSILCMLIRHLITAYKNSFIMAWFLSRNTEKGVLQHSYTFRLLQGCIKAIAKLMAILGKPFRASVDNSGIGSFINTITQGFSSTPLALIGLLGFVFMLTNLIGSVVIAKGFSYPGTILRTAALLIFLLLMRMNVEGKALLKSSFVFRFIKYMID
jgi:hypothetical protein